MESLSFYVLTMIALIASVFITLLFHYILKHSDASHPNLPPGNTGFPIIGETFAFLSAGRQGCPRKFITDRMAKYSSEVFKTSILGLPMVVLDGTIRNNKFLFLNENKLVTLWAPDSLSKMVFPTNSQASGGEKSKHLRGFLLKILKPEALLQFIGVMDSVAQTHFEADWEGEQQVNVFQLAKKYSLLVSLKVFLSIENGKQFAKLANHIDVFVKGVFSMPINFPGTNFYHGVKASKVIINDLTDVIKQRKIDLAEKRASPTQDILSQMLLTCDEDGHYMTEMEIVENILTVLIAGIDTSSTVIALTIKCLSEFPDVYNEVLNEQLEITRSKGDQEKLLSWNDIHKMKYSWNVVCESMRIAPGFSGFRETIKDVSLDGFIIPKGWKVYRSPDMTHMNPDYFPEPEKFDPTRFAGKGPAPYTFVPFGGGSRICPGKDYARLFILVYIHNVVKRFRWKKLLPRENIIVNPLPMPANGLPVHLFPHEI